MILGDMKKLGLVAIWIVATGLATIASVAAVRLVGSGVIEPPSDTNIASAITEAAAQTTITNLSTTVTPSDQVLAGEPAGTTPTTTETTAADKGNTGSESSGGPTTPPTRGTTATTITTAPATSPTTTPPSTPTTTLPITTTSTSTTSTSTTTTTTVPSPFTFVAIGGSVTVTCSGDDVSLSGAVPAAGYTTEVKESGPDEVKVEFDLIDGEAESEIEVECNAGQATAEIDED